MTFNSTAFIFSADIAWDGALKWSFLFIFCSLMYESKIIVPFNLGAGHPSVFQERSKVRAKKWFPSKK